MHMCIVATIYIHVETRLYSLQLANSSFPLRRGEPKERHCGTDLLAWYKCTVLGYACTCLCRYVCIVMLATSVNAQLERVLDSEGE